jgi:fermentation-respiration switch protein FrsA (DUF1100 family)
MKKPDDTPSSPKPARRRAWLKRLIGYPVAFLLLCLVTNMLGLVDGLFYVPDSRDYGKPDPVALPYEEVEFPSGDGTRLTGWFFANAGRRKGTVIHVHGNAANITNHYHGIAFLPAAEYQVLEFDYRGYGRSEGSPSRSGCLADVHAAIDYVKGRKNVDPERIVLFGQSLGAAFAIVAAAERPEVKAVAAEAPFTSHRAIARAVLRRNPVTWPFAWFLPDLTLSGAHAPINAVDRIAPRPLLLLHGKADKLIPFGMSEELLARAKEPKRLHAIPGGGHLDIPDPDTARAYRGALVGFYDEALGPLPPAPRVPLPTDADKSTPPAPSRPVPPHADGPPPPLPALPE